MLDLFAEPQRKTPRPYQLRAIDRIRSSLAGGKRRPVLQLATGAGKTLTAALIVRMALDKGNRVVFTVPALSLIDQTVAAFEAEGISGIGVIQADHPRTDPMARVQVASVQTLVRRGLPETDMVIVDEAHIGAKAIRDWMAQRPDLVFLGLSATPWRKGMGGEFDDLLIGATIGELIDGGYLSPFRVFAPAHPDLTGVKTTAGEYQQDQLAEVMAEGGLVAGVVRTWLEKGEDRPTLCFAVDRAHAKKLQAEFEASGVRAGYVDAYTDPVERKLVASRFERGEYRVVCNVRTLTTGVDWPVGCIIDAQPTKSEMLHVQKIGRGLRVNEGLTDCLILDHASNHVRLGFVTDIHHDELLTGAKERGPREVSVPLPKECPSCSYLKPPKVHECPACGFKPERVATVEETEGELVQVKGKAKSFSRADKQRWYSELLSIQRDRGRALGWVAHTYRKKVGCWPRGLDETPAKPTREVLNYVRSLDIAYAKSKGKRHAA